MDEITTIGLDLAKHVFHVVGCDRYGKVLRRKMLRRGQVRGKRYERTTLPTGGPGCNQPDAENRRDLLEIIEDRYGIRSTVVTSQLPVEKWHDVVGDPTLADAILDRLVHSAYQLNLKGESMRKRRRALTQTSHRGP